MLRHPLKEREEYHWKIPLTCSHGAMLCYLNERINEMFKASKASSMPKEPWMCLRVHDIWKIQFLLLILHILLNKSKNTVSSFPIILAILWQAEITGKLFGVGTVLCRVCYQSFSPYFFVYFIHEKLHANNWKADYFSSRWKTVHSSSGGWLESITQS